MDAGCRRGPPPLGAVLAGLLAVAAPCDAQAGTSDNADRGVEYFAGYTADLLANVDGGLRTGEAYLDYMEIGASLDLGELAGLDGVTAQASGFMTNAARFSERYVGDAMVVSNIDNAYALQILEAWVQWTGGTADRYSALLGLYDLNSEFDVGDARTLFMNSAHGIGHEIAQTGVDGPSIFPTTALAARFAWQPSSVFTLRVAATDGVPGSRPGINGTRLRVSSDEGALLIAEASVSVGSFSKLALGQWGYSNAFEVLPEPGEESSERTRHNHGTYVSAEIAPRPAVGDAATEAPWRLFGRVGYAEPDVNEFDLQLAAGAAARLAWPGPQGSELGLAWVLARLSDRQQRLLDADGLSGDPEQNVELTWRVPLGTHVVLQPDLQYVIDPADDRTARDAWVVGLRVEVAAAW